MVNRSAKLSLVYLPRLHNIFGNMLPKKMLAKRHGFIIQVPTMVISFQHHTHIVHRYRCRLGYIYPHYYKTISDHKRLLVRLLQSCELGKECWGLHCGLDFIRPCCQCWYHKQKQPSDRSPIDLVVSMTGIYKHTDVKLIKKRPRKMLINLLD